LALLHAISACPANPVIDTAAVTWGWAVVEHLTKRMLHMAASHVFTSDFDAQCKKLLSILADWHERQGQRTWMPAWQVMRRMKLATRDLDSVRESLVGQQLVEYGERRTGGPPQRLFRLLAPLCASTREV
jgi:hypothetical protein